MSLHGTLFFAFALCFVVEVKGHGYMNIPTNRASLWRVDWRQPVNYNDNEYFCGGTYVQYYKNQGRCGPCGDDWRDPIPRSNENGGKFGNGIIVANYTAGAVIEITSMITANHLGSLYFHICQLTNASQSDTEECFIPLKLADGSTRYTVNPLDLKVETKVRLPKDLVCERCVLRWHYRTGNSWGLCDDGTQDMGCGNQEIFRSCADIRIVPDDSSNESDDSSNEDLPDDSDDSSNEVPPDDSHEDPSDHDKNQPCILNPNYNPHSPRNNKESKHRF